jgi:hypothetical protein
MAEGSNVFDVPNGLGFDFAEIATEIADNVSTFEIVR